MEDRDTSIDRRLEAALPFSPVTVLYFTAGLFAVTGVVAMSNDTYATTSDFLFEGFMNVGMAAFVVAATWLYLGRSELPRSSWWHVVTGYMGGIAFIAILLLWAYLPDLRAGLPLLALREDFVFYGNLGGLFGFFVGVSRARSEYNRRLRRELEVSNELVESSQEALWMFSDDFSELLYANAAFETVLGQPVEALEADPTAFLEAVHPEDRAFVREQMDRLSAGEALEYEVRVNPEEEYGRWVWVEAQPIYRDGEQFAVSGFARDITDRKEYEKRVVRLHETTRRLFRAETRTEAAEIATAAARDVLDLQVNSIWFHDETAEALVPAASTPEAEAIFGDAPTFEAGEGLAWEVFESGEPAVFDDVSSRPAAVNPETEMRGEMILPLDGAGVFIAGSRTAEAFEGRQVSLAKLLATNVASALERIKKQRELEARQRELEHQIERLDEFAGIVSHDLRNPLSVARGHLELLAEDRELGSHPDLRKVEDALDRMSRLIDDLLDLARAGEQIDELEPVSLDHVVRSAWNSVETDDATLRTDLERRVLADESRLAQLFENLFRNAVEHSSTRPGSQARQDAVEPCSTSLRSHAHEDAVEHGGTDVTVTVGALADGFFVADDGPGIPQSEREDVFDAGYSTNDAGTGFGLSIVQEIVDAHDWRVAVTESAEGGGRFEIRGVDDHE